MNSGSTCLRRWPPPTVSTIQPPGVDATPYGVLSVAPLAQPGMRSMSAKPWLTPARRTVAVSPKGYSVSTVSVAAGPPSAAGMEALSGPQPVMRSVFCGASEYVIAL